MASTALKVGREISEINEEQNDTRPISGDDRSSSSTEVVEQKIAKPTPKDFIFIRSIGEGSFSTVYMGKEVSSGRELAIKVCNKSQIFRENKIHLIHREKDVMTRLLKAKHPCFVTLHSTFQDSERLYFAMTLAKRGEMLAFLRKLGSFDDQVTQFYAAEIVSALEHLHNLGIIHRDLKPENVLLAENMHILISDFGSAKILGVNDGPSASRRVKITETDQAKIKQRSSFVGTAQYVTPEVLNGKEVGPACDFWALGAIIYQMLAGLPPFWAVSEYLVFQKILNRSFYFPQGFPQVARDLVNRFLTVDPSARLGSCAMGGICAVKNEPFFSSIDWSNLHRRDAPVLKPYLPASGDEPAFHSDYDSSVEHLEPGLDNATITRLMCLQLGLTNACEIRLNEAENQTKEERKRRLDEQRRTNHYHRFVEDHLILKSGILEKKKGLFARRRMFLLTEGPHLYYVDPANMELKGEIPCCRQMCAEAKNFRTFFVHTPNRTYYLFDPSRHAIEWCEAIEKVRKMYFCHEEDAEADKSNS